MPRPLENGDTVEAIVVPPHPHLAVDLVGWPTALMVANPGTTEPIAVAAQSLLTVAAIMEAAVACMGTDPVTLTARLITTRAVSINPGITHLMP
jgi:hypothetical protein